MIERTLTDGTEGSRGDGAQAHGGPTNHIEHFADLDPKER